MTSVVVIRRTDDADAAAMVETRRLVISHDIALRDVDYPSPVICEGPDTRLKFSRWARARLSPLGVASATAIDEKRRNQRTNAPSSFWLFLARFRASLFWRQPVRDTGVTVAGDPRRTDPRVDVLRDKIDGAPDDDAIVFLRPEDKELSLLADFLTLEPKIRHRRFFLVFDTTPPDDARRQAFHKAFTAFALSAPTWTTIDGAATALEGDKR